MSVYNPTGHDSIKSKATPEDLAEAMTALRLHEMPLEKRARAITTQLARVMLTKTTSPLERAKDNFQGVRKIYHKMTGILL